ncbi:hypothetical protein BDA96_03G431800 [Sorghum bicolor]|uniref:Uncharacterized protein n=1 Tax=Sorghum bicolor TaxID=4558 RepID=A0A921UQG3_SORBI|nr:hypothetical protein BDA96_03G431800 [Sorghum bicolor]KAG0540704.1 hypothetical protein BDA96_03G431800 [Sorghum bicolor]
MESMKANAAGARHVVKNRRLAVVINVALNLLYSFLYVFYVGVFTELLKRLEVWTAGAVILFIVNPCFLVIWRILSFYRTVYDDIVNGDVASKIPLEKTSVLV